MSAYRTLHLVSPHERDGQDHAHPKDVSSAQKLLHTVQDGEFGPESAQAAKHAHWQQGFPRRKCKPQFGPKIRAILNGQEARPLAYRVRRRARLAAEARRRKRGSIGKHALEHALLEVGVKEDPAGSNDGPRVRFYQSATGAYKAPWCASFASKMLDLAGAHRDRSINWAYCPAILAAAQAGRCGLHRTRSPELGDLILYDWDGDRVADHVEFFDGWVAKGESFRSVGGNTGPSSNNNGGEVCRYPSASGPARTTAVVLGFVHYEERAA